MKYCEGEISRVTVLVHGFALSHTRIVTFSHHAFATFDNSTIKLSLRCNCLLRQNCLVEQRILKLGESEDLISFKCESPDVLVWIWEAMRGFPVGGGLSSLSQRTDSRMILRTYNSTSFGVSLISLDGGTEICITKR